MEEGGCITNMSKLSKHTLLHYVRDAGSIILGILVLYEDDEDIQLICKDIS